MPRVFLGLNVLALLLAIFFLGLPAAAGERKGDVRFVETDVVLNPDGSALVGYTVQWEVTGDRMRGFVFAGNDRLQAGSFNQRSHALDGAGNRYKLNIEPLQDNGYRILLDNGHSVSSGRVTYKFWFSADFVRARYLVSTTTDQGREAVVFNWAPVKWDEAERQKHSTLRVHTPYQLPATVDPRDYVLENNLILTETWVNERYKMDYQRGENGHLVLVFHRDDPGPRFSMLAQFYMPAKWFTFSKLSNAFAMQSGQDELANRAADQSRHSQAPGVGLYVYRLAYAHPFLLFGIGACVLLALFYLLTLGKQRSMVKARQGLDDVRWDSLNWEPPKLKLANFRVADKVCTDLTPLEAAFYLEIPFRRILSAMFHSMVKEGYLKAIATQPVLRAQLLRSPGPDMEIYERMFLHAFADDNELSQQ
ncbi:MAG: hypothetical protein R6U55_14430 [Desulfovermiculus sp.]